MNVKVYLLPVQAYKDICHFLSRTVCSSAVLSFGIVMERLRAQTVAHLISPVNEILHSIAVNMLTRIFFLPFPDLCNSIVYFGYVIENGSGFVVHTQFSLTVIVIVKLYVTVAFSNSVHHAHNTVMLEVVKKRAGHLFICCFRRSPAYGVIYTRFSVRSRFKAPSRIVAVFIFHKYRISNWTFRIRNPVLILEHFKCGRIEPACMVTKILNPCRSVGYYSVKISSVWSLITESLRKIAFIEKIRCLLLRIFFRIFRYHFKQFFPVFDNRPANSPECFRNCRRMRMTVNKSGYNKFSLQVCNLALKTGSPLISSNVY